MLAALSASEIATQSVDARIAASDPAVSLSRFVDYPQKGLWGDPDFKPNTNFWLKGVDFSCVSPWNSGGGALRAGTAISKRHIIFAKHFPLWKGVRILFVGEDGGVCPCSIEATKVIDKSDIMIGLLNAELTPNIHPAKILPADYEKYIGTGAGLPVVTFNQREEAVVAELFSIKTNSVFRLIDSHKPFMKTKERKNYCRDIVGGDSGNPAFLIFQNEPLLLYCLKGPNSGPGLHLYRREIQAAMDELCPGYKLETFDFEKVRCDDEK